MNNHPRVFVSGPYTKPDPVVNTRAAIDAADKLFELGCFPYVPHLSMFWHMVHARPWEDWLRLDQHWLRQCDCVLRLPGESPGAGKECLHAAANNIPVFDSIEAIQNAMQAAE